MHFLCWIQKFVFQGHLRSYKGHLKVKSIKLTIIHSIYIYFEPKFDEEFEFKMNEVIWGHLRSYFQVLSVDSKGKLVFYLNIRLFIRLWKILSKQFKMDPSNNINESVPSPIFGFETEANTRPFRQKWTINFRPLCSMKSGRHRYYIVLIYEQSNLFDHNRDGYRNGSSITFAAVHKVRFQGEFDGPCVGLLMYKIMKISI